MANTGYKAWYNLNRVNKTTGGILETKENVDTDPDYVAPVQDTTYCPIPDNEAPTFPTALYATGQTTTSISMAWQSADNVGVTEQILYYYRQGGTWQSIILDKAATSYTLTGLDENVSYDLRLTAKDAAGNSTESRLLHSTEAVSTVSITPTNATVPSDGGTVYISVTSDGAWSVRLSNTGDMTSSASSGTGDSNFSVTVDAFTAEDGSRTLYVYVDNSDSSQTATCTITQDGPSSGPGGVT